MWVGRPLQLVAVGVVERAIKEGRPFALADLADAHQAAQASAINIAKHFEDNPAVEIQFFYNSGATIDIPAKQLRLEQVDTGGEYSYDNKHGTELGGTKAGTQPGDHRSGLERFRAATREDIVGVFRDAVAGRITVGGKGPSHELLVQLAGRDAELQQILKESGK